METINFFGFDVPNLRFSNNHMINWTRKFPIHPDTWSFERYFAIHGNEVQLFTQQTWHYCFPLSIAYIAIIFGIRSLMNYREKGFNLKGPLFFWNLFLAVFSIIGTYRCVPEFVSIIVNEGFQASYTKSSYYDNNRVSVWYLFFTVSKAVELIDTLFIVLRKSKLIHLHWIHHVLTLCFSWFAFVDVPGTARWMVTMNFAIHSIMYSYYALKSVNVYIPKRVSVMITTLQVLQMFAGLYVNYQCLKFKVLGFPVDISYSTASFSFTLYFIFSILFLNFFIRTYILRPGFGGKKKGIQILSDINHNHYKSVAKKLQ